MSSRARKLTAAVVAVVLVVGLGVTAVVELTKSSNSGPAQCRVAIGPSSFVLEIDQATNATTIAASYAPRHARSHGDGGRRHRVAGIRPPQSRPRRPRLTRPLPTASVAGLGAAEEILTPTYTARVFCEHLRASRAGRRWR